MEFMYWKEDEIPEAETMGDDGVMMFLELSIFLDLFLSKYLIGEVINFFIEL